MKRTLTLSILLLFASNFIDASPWPPAEDKKISYIQSLLIENRIEEAYIELEKGVKAKNPYLMGLLALNIVWQRAPPFDDMDRAYELAFESVSLGNMLSIIELTHFARLFTFREEERYKINDIVELLQKYNKGESFGPYIEHYIFLHILNKDFDKALEFFGPKRVLLGASLDTSVKGKLKVIDIAPYSVAEESGIQIGDILYEIDDQLLTSYENLTKIQSKLDSFSSVKLKVIRGLDELVIPVMFKKAMYVDERTALHALRESGRHIQAYQLAIESNQKRAQSIKNLILCESYFFGYEVEKDAKKAVNYCREVINKLEEEAKEFNPNDRSQAMNMHRLNPMLYDTYRLAQMSLGMYFSGQWKVNGVSEKQLQMASKLLERSSFLFLDSKALYYQALIQNELKNSDRWMELLQRSSDMGYAYAQDWLGHLLLDPKLDVYDPQESIYLLKQAADKGIARSQGRLSDIYFEGKYVNRDDKKGKEYLIKAAEKKQPRYVFRLAMKYYDGIDGFELDNSKAKKLNLEAIELGYEYAKGVLAYMNFAKPEELRPSTKDLIDSEKILLERAKDDGHIYTLIGSRYSQGFGMKADRFKACSYFEKLNQLGDKYGKFMYSTCDSISNKETISLLRESSSSGVSQASHILGSMYESGESGLPVNNQMAVHYFTKALENRTVDNLNKYYLDLYTTDVLQVNKSTARNSLKRVQQEINSLAREGRRAERQGRRAERQERRVVSQNSPKSNSYSFGSFLGDLLKVALVVAIADEAVETWEETSDENKGYILEGLNSTLESSTSSYDYDWDWDAFYDQYGYLQWRCRGIQTGRFAENYQCFSDIKDDDRWPRK